MNIKREMLKIYKPISGLDWLNYKLVKEDISYHHIQKRENGGKKTIENGALLMPVGHQYLHLIECVDIRYYDKLNAMFKLINEQREEPSIPQRVVIEYILQEFERLHRWDKSNKGKILIQHKYLKRGFNDEG